MLETAAGTTERSGEHAGGNDKALWRAASIGPTGTDLAIHAAEVQRQPAQKGLAGGQPWAIVRWNTNRPATTQVEYVGPAELLRRTPLQTRLTTDHEARVEFLRADQRYRFTAVSVTADLAVARALVAE